MPRPDRPDRPSMVRASLVGLALASSLLLPGVGLAGQRREGPPNVVFILVDDMGWTDLGVCGSDLYETPNIDRLAAQGMRFTDGYSACTVCSPSRAAVMTGQYPARLHVTDWIHGHKRPHAKLKVPDWTEYLPIDRATAATALGRAGYATASIGKWHLGDGPEHEPTEYGFDVNVAGFGAGSPTSYFSPYKNPNLEDGPEGEFLTDRLTEEACRFMEANRDRPFFAYLPHYAVHTPLQAKQELIEHYQKKIKPGMRHTNATFAAMVHSLDQGVGRLMAKLDELGLADDTVVIFTSDNGGLMLREVTNNAPLRAGKGSTYEGGVRVPLIVRWPGVTPAGSLCREPVLSVDYLPTLLEIAGPRARDGHEQVIDGLSIVKLLGDPDARLDRDAIYWHYPHYHPGGATPYAAVRARDWKLIEFFEDDHVELYNLADDLGESKDLARSHPEKAGELWDRLHAWRREVGAQLPSPNPAYDPARAEEPAPRKARTKDARSKPRDSSAGR